MIVKKAALAAATFLMTAAVGQAVDWQNPQAVAEAAVGAHPALQVLRERATAARELTISAGAYPNPMLMGGVQNQHIDLSNDEIMTMYMVGASQMVPRKARREALREAAHLQTRRIELEEAILREEIRRDAILAWYDLAAADSQAAATREIAAAMEAVVAAARARYETGAAMQADVARAQLERSDVDHQALGYIGKRRRAAARLLALLGMPMTTEVPPLHLAHDSARAEITALPSVPDSHPSLLALRTDAETLEQQLRLAELLAKPDWNIEASYALRTEMKDMFSVVARVELPVRRKTTIQPRIRAAAAERDAARSAIDAERRRINEALGLAYALHAEANDQLALHENVLVPQAKLVFDSTLAAYQTGATTLDTVLETETAYLRLQIDYYDLLAQHIKAIVDFEALQRGARAGGAIGSGPSPANGME